MTDLKYLKSPTTEERLDELEKGLKDKKTIQRLSG